MFSGDERVDDAALANNRPTAAAAYVYNAPDAAAATVASDFDDEDDASDLQTAQAIAQAFRMSVNSFDTRSLTGAGSGLDGGNCDDFNDDVDIEPPRKQQRQSQTRRPHGRASGPPRQIGAMAAAATAATSADSGSSDSAPPDAPIPEDKIVSVVHPHDARIETILGERTEADDFCYIRDVVNLSETTRMSEPVQKLLKFIEDNRIYHGNRLELARLIKKHFDENIYNPFNERIRQANVAAARLGKPLEATIPEWTLRSIYEYISHDDISTSAIQYNVTHLFNMMLDTIRHNGLFVAVQKAGENEPDMKTMQLNRSAAQMAVSVATKMLQVARTRPVGSVLAAEPNAQPTAKGGRVQTIEAAFGKARISKNSSISAVSKGGDGADNRLFPN